jgi:hypothetical protein
MIRCQRRHHPPVPHRRKRVAVRQTPGFVRSLLVELQRRIVRPLRRPFHINQGICQAPTVELSRRSTITLAGETVQHFPENRGRRDNIQRVLSEILSPIERSAMVLVAGDQQSHPERSIRKIEAVRAHVSAACRRDSDRADAQNPEADPNPGSGSSSPSPTQRAPHLPSVHS